MPLPPPYKMPYLHSYGHFHLAMALNLHNPLPSKTTLKPSLPLPKPPFLSPHYTPPQQTRLHLSLHKPPPFQVLLSSPSPPQDTSPSPPTSREEAISQAKSCLSTALQKPFNNPIPLPTRKLKKQRQPRYRAEIPVIDDSPDSLARLAFELFSDLPVSRKGSKAKILLLWPSSKVLGVAVQEFKNSGNSTVNAELSSVTSDLLSSCDVSVFLAAEQSQLEEIRGTTEGLYPKPVVLFNPKWSFEEEKDLDGNARSFVGSFDVVYSFMGLEVKGLLSKRKGVVFRCVKDGVFGGENWVVMVEEEVGRKKGKLKVVSRFKRRPTIGEVESVLYNLMAANSPVTKSAKFLRELVSNVTGRKGKQ